MIDFSSIEVIAPLMNMVNWLVDSLATAVPLLLSGAIIIIIGWVLSKIVEKIVRKSLHEFEFSKWEKKNDIDNALYGVKLSDVIIFSLKWYVVLLFLNEAATEVNLPFVASIIQLILLLVPNWFLGTLFLGIALIFGHKVSSRVEKSRLLFGKIGARIIYLVTLYFALVMALPKFGFENTEILVDTFRLLVAGVSLGGAIAIGIGFGAAMKEPAKSVIKDLFK
ncbi:MAG: hypothetical protein GON13_00660 [Nanoarchaeota archaeon]|nr:hypothetical protein [Nanoarchaeota archaeon]